MLLCLCSIHYLLWFLPCLRPATAFLCPIGCCCPPDDTLALCEFLGLRSLPHSLPLNTSVLSVAHNLICNMDHLLESFLGLQELSLSHNQLDHFPRGLPASLQSLQIQRNLITYVTSRALRHLGRLLHLDLEDNRIRAIQPGAFLGVSRLQVLNLKGNRLSSLPLHMPSSLTHLDVSANCILALELPSIVSLVNLEILKINSNCLHSIPESAFDGLAHLHSVELSNNLWVCECDILYLYQWLQKEQTTATDLICAEPLHVAQKTLLSLPITVLCPGNRDDKVTYENIIAASHLQSSRSRAKDATSAAESSGHMAQPALTDLHPHMLQAKIRSGKVLTSRTNTRQKNQTNTSAFPRLYASPYSLGGLTYQDCLSLDNPEETPSSSSPPLPETHTSCLAASTRHHQPGTLTLGPGVQPASSSSTTTTSFSGEVEMLSSPSSGRVLFQPKGRDIVAVLSVLCVLMAFLLVAVLLLLKMALLQNQRVHPMQQC